jgi:hypothetical protein
MTFHRRGVHAERPDIVLAVGFNLVAHGGELAISAGSIVAGIKDQQDPRLGQQVVEVVGPAVGRGSGKVRSLCTRLKQSH